MSLFPILFYNVTLLQIIPTVVILGYVVLFVDIDECVNTAVCHVNATCTNTEGNYSCACNEGYTGNGTVCTGMNDYFMNTNVQL